MTTKRMEAQGFVRIKDDDNAYKVALQRFFWDALELGAPKLYSVGDTEKKPTFLEQEFAKMTLEMDGKANRTDLLARVPLKDGTEKYVLWHAEVQGAGGGDLPMRMRRYNAMILLKHKEEPAACAIITQNRPKDEADYYYSNTYGTEVTYKYNSLIVKDLDDDALVASQNRFAMILYAAKKSLESGSDEPKKFTYLREISNQWAKRGWSNEDKRLIMNIVEYLINLKDPVYEEKFNAHLEEIEKEEHIMYVTIPERVGMRKGLEKGIREGKLETARRMLEMGIDRELAAKATGLPQEEIDALQR